jgi:hypothetical protein
MKNVFSQRPGRIAATALRDIPFRPFHPPDEILPRKLSGHRLQVRTPQADNHLPDEISQRSAYLEAKFCYFAVPSALVNRALRRMAALG